MATWTMLPSVSGCGLSRPFGAGRSGLALLVCWAALALRGQRVRAPQPAPSLWLAVVVALLGAALWHIVTAFSLRPL